MNKGYKGQVTSQNYALIHQQPGVPLTNEKYHNFQLNPALGQGAYQNADSLVTENLLLQLTDCDSLDQIKVISLRNKQLQSCLKILSQCANLTIAYLQGNAINLVDQMYLQTFQNLKKLDLSFNNITSLPSANVLSGLTNLKFLYLHNNNISSWNDITSLTSIPSVLHITLFANSVCTIPGYRHYMVNSCQSLLALDHYVITDEERIEDASFGYRFRGLNEYMKLHIPDYAKEKSAEAHLFNLEVDIYRLKRIFERNSPSILIQSLYRGYRSRNYVKIYFNEKKHKIITIQKMVRGWLLRKKLRRDLHSLLKVNNDEYLMLSNRELRMQNAARILQKVVLKWFRRVKRKKQELNGSLTIQRYFRGRITKNTSFINAFELHKYPRIYFLKEQKPLFLKVVRSLGQIFKGRQDFDFDDIYQYVHEDNNFDTIRVAEPDLFKYNHLPMVQFVKPSMISRVRFNKGQPAISKKGFTLAEYFFTTNRQETERKLKLIKKRNCYIRQNRLKRIFDTINQKKHKNQYMFQDQYKDFLVFVPPSLDILITLCFAILDYNRQSNIDKEEPLLLVFFESLLIKVSAATRIQQAWRAYKFRCRQQIYPVQRVMNQRAAYCIQRWWSNLKLIKRVEALQKIKRHIDKINSNELYIEQTLYNSISQVVSLVSAQMRFEEQNINFDFQPTNHQIYLYVQEKNRDILRYEQTAVPKWFNLNFKASDFDASPYINNLLAFFHYNEGDCGVYPANYVLKNGHPHLDIDRDMTFVQLKCTNIDEAKRRAVVMAYLTYNIHQHLFVQLATAQMLENPFIIQNIKRIKEIYGIEDNERYVDLKHNYHLQKQQNNQGMILSQKDARMGRLRGLVKQIQTQERPLLITCYDQQESEQMDMEMLLKETREHIDPKLAAQMLQQNTKKMQEEHAQQIKEKRQQLIKESIDAFKLVKQEQKALIEDENEKLLTQKRDDAHKHREISKIIQNEQKEELERNLMAFLTLNKEEKVLRKELVEKQMEVDYKEKYLKKVNVLQMHKNRILKREEQQLFINSFAQAKNLIEKQMKIGLKIKEKTHDRKVKQDHVKTIRNARSQGKSQQAVVLKSVLYDNTLNDYGQDQSRIEAQKKSYIPHGNYTSELTQADDSFKHSYNQHHGGKSANKSINKSYFLPPLYDSSFANDQSLRQPMSSNQVNTYVTNDQELQREIHEIYKTTLPNMVNLKKNYQRPIFAEESFPLVKGSSGLDAPNIAYTFDHSRAQANQGIYRKEQIKKNYGSHL